MRPSAALLLATLVSFSLHAYSQCEVPNLTKQLPLSISPPCLLMKVEPNYSEEARAAHVEGKAILSVVVDHQGNPQNLKVVRSLGFGLDQKAIEAVQKWRFQPGTKDGKPVAVIVTVEVNFRLLSDPDELRVKADRGDANAEYELGLLYALGKGVPKDYVEAARLMRKAAEQDLPPAQFSLGTMYANGQGVTRDDAEAAEWYQKAAKAGDAAAETALGNNYATGRGVTRDDVEAAGWWRKAADAGNAGAQYNLGAAYSQGRGMQQDYLQAYMWLKLSALGPSQAQQQRAGARDAVAKKLTPEQLAEAERLIGEWKPKPQK
jgi:TonB family protein